MSHSNKRYVVYRTPSPWYHPRYIDWFWDVPVGSPYWGRQVCSRTEVVNLLCKFYRNDEIVKFTSDMSSVSSKDTYLNVPKKISSRPGVKEWDCVKVTWFCIKIIRNGVEEDVNLKGLISEAERKAAQPECKHGRYWSRSGKYCTPWKDQYKCKHQYEIHVKKHMDKCKDAKIVI